MPRSDRPELDSLGDAHAESAGRWRSASPIASSGDEPGNPRPGRLDPRATGLIVPPSRCANSQGTPRRPSPCPHQRPSEFRVKWTISRGKSRRLRDVARRRVRNATLAAAALAAAATGVIASVTASSSTTTRKVVRQLLAATAITKTVTAVPEPTATVPAQGASAPSAAPSVPSSAPSSVSQSSTPVVVSGGS
jgi:hypothetical protein